MMPLMLKTVFLVNVILISYSIVSNVMLGKRLSIRKWKQIKENGLFKYYLNRMPFYCIEIFSLFVAYRVALHSLFWLIMGLIFSAIVILGLGAVFILVGDGKEMPPLDDNYLRRNIKYRRWIAVVNLLILTVWIYSWKPVVWNL